MGLDYGTVRLGVAVSDPTRTLATPLETIKNNRAAAVRLKELIGEYEISTLVVGYPLNLKGEADFAASKVDEFLEQLSDLEVEVIKWDERFSSFTAEGLLREAGADMRRDKGRVDRSAAAVILQHYLDSVKNR